MKHQQWTTSDIRRAKEMGFALVCAQEFVDAYHIVALEDTPKKFTNDKQAVEWCLNVAYGDTDKSTPRTKTCRKALFMCCLGFTY